MPSTAETLGALENGTGQVGASNGVDITAQQQQAAMARAANGGIDPIAGAATAPGVLGQAVASGPATAAIGGAANDFVATTIPGLPAPPTIGATPAPDGNSYVPNPYTNGWMSVQPANTHTGSGQGGGDNGGNGGA